MNRRCRLRQRVTHLQGQQRERGATVRDEVPRIRIQRPSPPTAGGTLIGLQPRDPFLKAGIAGGDTGISQNDDRQAGHVAVARWGGELRFGLQLPDAQPESGCSFP